MQEFLFFLSGFILCLIYFKIKQKNKIIPANTSSSSSDNTLASEQKVLDQIPDQIIIINREKNIIFANKSSLERFGKNIEQNHIAEVIRRPEFLEGIDNVLQNNISTVVKTEIKKPTFQVYESYIFPSPQFFLGKEQSVFILMRDLTDIFKIQQLKSDFVANVSHELRTPLQTIKLGLETISSGHAKNDEKEKNNFLSLMHKESIRMEHLIKDLLMLSKIEQQEHIKPSSKINLQEVLDYVQKFYQEQLKKKNITVQVNLDQNNLNIVGDKDKLIEVFANLISNSIKYSDPDKNIYINSTQKSEDRVEIKIKDEGIGIPQELLPRISERFFRVDSEKTRKVNGTGLGLAIVKHIIKQHRGEFVIQSSEGMGTEIKISLPKYS
jgi:two-component system, OmpR family, phosphate regulon sensor histidine kinase PhoR